MAKKRKRVGESRRTASATLKAVVALNVRTLRAKNDYSQQGFADHAGIDRTYVGGLEHSRQNPGLGTLEALAKGFGVHPAELLIDPTGPFKLVKRRS